MRKHTIKLLVITMTAVSLTGCDLMFLLFPPAPLHEPEPGFNSIIIKFKQAHYKEHIMVMGNDTSSDSLYIAGIDLQYKDPIYFMTPTSLVNLYGQSPYIDLTYGYLLVDWKWELMIPLESQSIIIAKWEELTDARKKWTAKMLYVRNPISEYHIIGDEQIQDFLEAKGENVEHKPIHMRLFRDTEWQTASQATRDEYETEVAYRDAAQKEYAGILIRMIQEGYFDNKQ